MFGQDATLFEDLGPESAPFKICRPGPVRALGAVSCQHEEILSMRATLDGDPERASGREFHYRPVFAAQSLDLCILEVLPNQAHLVPALALETRIDLRPVRIGQQVVVAGHPSSSIEPVIEHCMVVAEPALVRDPDQVAPTDTEVISFGIDCDSIQHGSSGSPVFDATTGLLLGLLWTRDCGVSEPCQGTSYASAASAWLQSGDEMLAAHDDKLEALIDAYRFRQRST